MAYKVLQACGVPWSKYMDTCITFFFWSSVIASQPALELLLSRQKKVSLTAMHSFLSGKVYLIMSHSGGLGIARNQPPSSGP